MVKGLLAGCRLLAAGYWLLLLGDGLGAGLVAINGQAEIILSAWFGPSGGWLRSSFCSR